MFAILGAAGKVGRSTIHELRGRGMPVRAVLRDASRAGELAALGCETAVADLRDGAALQAAISGAQAVQVICPMSVHASDAPTEMASIIETIGAALEAARPAAIVAISDYGAELDRGTGVTLTFHHLEARLRKLPASLTFLRSAEQMQNWSRHTGFAASTGVLPSMHQPLTKLFPTVSAVDVGVVAAELLTATNSAASPRIVHVEGPRRYTPLDVAATLGGLLDREVTARQVPRADWIPALVRGGLGESYAALVADLYDAHNAGRIDVERGVGEVRYGETELREVLASLLRQRRPAVSGHD
jgi:NAD(P)H dehydrogenase (quinone)